MKTQKNNRVMQFIADMMASMLLFIKPAENEVAATPLYLKKQQHHQSHPFNRYKP
jgi:hypothetical protein